MCHAHTSRKVYTMHPTNDDLFVYYDEHTKVIRRDVGKFDILMPHDPGFEPGDVSAFDDLDLKTQRQIFAAAITQGSAETTDEQVAITMQSRKDYDDFKAMIREILSDEDSFGSVLKFSVIKDHLFPTYWLTIYVKPSRVSDSTVQASA